MNYSKIITYDTANSHGYSVSLWVCGCTHNCKNCFNPELHNFQYGKVFNENTFIAIKNELKKPFIKNFVILGGEPLNEQNRSSVIKICKEIKEELPNINIIIYTGYCKDDLNLTADEKVCIDYLIDGCFEEEKKTYGQLRGSSNQNCWHFIDGLEKDISETYFKENFI